MQVQLELRHLGHAAVGVDLGGAWHPSLPHLVVANLLPLLPPDMTAVRFMFAPFLGGDWQIDDVYVDPRSQRVAARIVRADDRSARALARIR